MFRSINRCRICGGRELEPVMSLGNQVLTGVFPSSRSQVVTEGPVDLVRCAVERGCGLVQLLQSYDLQEMYGLNYGYRSSLNRSMVEHLQRKVARILALGVLRTGDVVVDIGSNDATTLKAYPQGVHELIGIDPTGVKFAEYYPPHIRLIPEFFSAAMLREAIGDRRARVITSFSMYYDLEDPVAFAREIAFCLDTDGVWVLEQSYLPAMLRTNSFDTICHEHLEFYGLKQIVWIAEAAGLKVLDVEFNDINGGSFSIMVARRESSHRADQSKIESILRAEFEMGLESSRAFSEFKHRVATAGKKLRTFLEDARNNGKRVCGLGASTKGNVLLQYFGIDESLLPAIGEVNSDKFGKFTPGTLIPLLSEDEVLASSPDYILILPWHFRSFFESLPKMKGRTLLFPLPELQVVRL
jgi:NDP-4-keto-2,6-dideoxyhexose 3-C-methyltransferase